jgi:general secretion pathway protein D
VPVLEQTAAALTGATGAQGEAKTVTITAHEGTNSLIISAAPAVYRELSAVVRQLDVRPLQVLIEGVIVEVSDEFAKELGVQWQSTNIDDIEEGGVFLTRTRVELD